MSPTIATRNHVNVSGHGPETILFAHGFGCDQNMWRFVAPAFENEYRTVLFDYVGSGKSDTSAYNDQRYRRLEGYAQDLIDICQELQLQDLIFVGHSVSCIIGMLAAKQHPHLFKTLILIGPSPCYINHPPHYHGGFNREDLQGLLHMMDKNRMGWASFLAPVVMKNPDQPELTQELEQSFCAIHPKIARQFAETTFFSDNRADLAHVALNLPILILQCSDDSIAPLEVGQYLHRELPGSTLKILQATGHCPHLSHPQETIQHIEDYLNTTSR
ncbi:alpha/beta hydrolase [Phragmitibacter flavus]|uniref:Alpha/beta hydrolase n=1 Tax=Phragmitibacter flavus TaxID=2576071 RepID=A0A5R8KAP1_9BACT|nr:alpha/beta hydrolase [Phragmitibacter flavus]TLD69382.1 alpha/beta hydrolase [Phragmitibacter flavus]